MRIDWDMAKEILRPDYYSFLLKKYIQLGEDDSRLIEFLEGEKMAFTPSINPHQQKLL